MLFKQRVDDVLSSLRQPSLRELHEALDAIGATAELIAPYVTEPDRLPYGRNVLFRSDHVEAIVVHIPPGSETFVHDHGRSVGCALLLEGAMLNATYRTGGGGEAFLVAQCRVPEGRRIEAPAKQIHRMSNPGVRRAVSLHLYAPPLAETNTYKPVEEYVLDYVI
ncbi:cysteine dioxygenase [Paenibacillus sp. GYB003]|uniref:cysteine dioxygenase n=1 Tax=Paenibacillus sp. GYB003 TaxID=2994392 RepID=UPI002F961899